MVDMAPWLAFAALLLAAPWVFTSSLGQSLLCQMGIAIIACLSYNILLGQGGMLSFGHAVYSGLGAFAAMHVLNTQWLPVSLVPLAGGVAGGLVAVLLGGLTCQRAATTFAMVTLGLGELVWAAAWLFPTVFGGEAGIAGNRVQGSAPWGISFGPQLQLYYLIAGYTLACTALVYGLTRTPLGRLLNALRDNPERVEFIGFDARQLRWRAVVIAGFFAGVAGGLAALNFEIVTADVLGTQRSGAYLLFTVLGGAGHFAGPVLGGILMVLAYVLLSGWTQAWLLYIGLVFVLVVVYAPGGISSVLLAQWRLLRAGQGLRLLPGYSALLGSAALAFTGLAALVEMVYHLQLQAALGPKKLFMGVQLDTSQWYSWTGAAVLLAVGAGLLRASWRWFAPPFRAAQQKGA